MGKLGRARITLSQKTAKIRPKMVEEGSRTEQGVKKRQSDQNPLSPMFLFGFWCSQAVRSRSQEQTGPGFVF